MPHIDLREWEIHGPARHGISDSALQFDAASIALIGALRESSKLELLQLRSGIEVRSTSWVGQLTLGNLSISVQPKIRGMPLLELLRYAYCLRDLETFDPSEYQVATTAFQDVLAAQLEVEAIELLTRGLHRDYLRITGNLHSPKGRIEFRKVMDALSAASPSLHCVYYNRSDAILLNRVLLAGLHLAASIAIDRRLRGRISQLTQILGSSIFPVALTTSQLVNARRTLDRRTIAYAPALTLIELLLEGQGPRLGEAQDSVRLPGFLFDMNRFFQSLISRFLRSELTGFCIQDERSLRDLFAFDPLRNPRGRSARAPRPDFSVTVSGKVIALLDAKYRDLWERTLPTAMLYQLAIYALSLRDADAQSIILYPTTAADATDQVVQFKDPIGGVPRAEVVLRPVPLLKLASLVRAGGGPQVIREREQLAHALVFGSEPSSDQQRRAAVS